MFCFPWKNQREKSEEALSCSFCFSFANWSYCTLQASCKILLQGLFQKIRAQLAACGAPLVGDSMYMPAAIAEIAIPQLNPFGKYKKQFASSDYESIAIAEWVMQHGKELSVAIGLQACQISWDDGKHVYEAGSSWWRCSIA